MLLDRSSCPRVDGSDISCWVNVPIALIRLCGGEVSYEPTRMAHRSMF